MSHVLLAAVGLGLALLASLHAVPAAAASKPHSSPTLAVAYPDRPIRLVIGLPPGGSSDVIARIVTASLAEVLGQQVVVDNRPGAAVLAPGIVAQAIPDGHTLLFRASFFAELVASIDRRSPYDLERDFAPVSLVAKVPNVLVLNLSIPARSVKEFVAYARANPGRLNYASSGIGSSAHLAMELFKKQTGIDVVHIPYKGAPQVIPDLLKGEIHVVFGNVPAQLPFVRSGRLRALAVTSAQRNLQLPEVPTMEQAGFPDLEITVWSGVLAPTGVPAPILAKLNAALVKTLTLPEVVKSLQAQGADPAPTTREAFAAFQKAEIARWSKVVEDSGVKSQ